MLLHHQLSMRVGAKRSVHVPVRKRVECRSRDLHQSLIVKLSRAIARSSGELHDSSAAQRLERAVSLDQVAVWACATLHACSPVAVDWQFQLCLSSELGDRQSWPICAVPGAALHRWCSTFAHLWTFAESNVHNNARCMQERSAAISTVLVHEHWLASSSQHARSSHLQSKKREADKL